MELETLYSAEMQNANFENVKSLEKSKKRSFWKRQFQIETTAPQKVFDGLFGICLPAICFLFDPVVFRGGVFSSGALIADFKPFAYALSFVSIMSLLAFILWGGKLKWLNALLSGIFAVSTIISLIVGALLFPFSLLGLIILIGLLGFTPLFTAFVFLRNTFRAYKTAQLVVTKSVLIHCFALSIILSLVVPAILNIKARKGLETMKNGDTQTIRRTARQFRYIAPLVNFDALAWEYQSNRSNPERDLALEESFYQLTGNNLKDLKDEKLKMRMAE